jgi:hypothetical protein
VSTLALHRSLEYHLFLACNIPGTKSKASFKYSLHFSSLTRRQAVEHDLHLQSVIPTRRNFCSISIGKVGQRDSIVTTSSSPTAVLTGGIVGPHIPTNRRPYESWNGVLVVNIPITVIPPPAQHCSNTRPALPRWTRGIEPNHPLPRPLAIQLCTMPRRPNLHPHSFHLRGVLTFNLWKTRS